MSVKKININQSEQTYYIASDIYDVSAHNNGTTFESLSALLSDEKLYTLIPTEVRCGGMTIRFVQSSDNKYVQYRLMTTTFSTTESDWQGVDEQPTVGSDNIVKSNGVFSSISEVNTKILSIPLIQANLFNDIESINITALSLPIVDKQGNVLSAKDTFGWMTVEKGKLYHVVGDINITNGQSIIVAWSAPPSSDTYIDNYNSYLTEGSYHIDTVIEAKDARLATSNGLSVYKCEKLGERIDTLEKEVIDGIFYENTYEKSGTESKFLNIPYSFKEGVGYCIELTNIVANSNIRLFTANTKGVGYNDCVQYIDDIEPKDNTVYFYCNSNAEYLFIQIITVSDTVEGFKVRISSTNSIIEIAKRIYLCKSKKPHLTNDSIGMLVEKGYMIGDSISLSSTNVKNFENGQVRPYTNKQWGIIKPNTDYFITGTANIARSENLLAIFSGASSVETFINDFDSYVQKGVYNVSFVFNSSDATRISMTEGLSLYPLIGLKSEEKPLLEKIIIDHLVTPTDGQSEITWRGIFSLIPKGSKITEYSYIPLSVGSNVCSIWKYDDEEKTMQKMEEIIITSTNVGTKTYIEELQNRVFSYDVFILFRKNGSESSAIGWTNDNTGSQLGISVSNGDLFSTKDINISATVGNMCAKVVYESDYFNQDPTVLEVGKGKAFESLSLAAFAACYGDTILVDSGTYKNNNIQSWGKKIHVIGKSKYSCILECDTSDYNNPPVEMNIGSISNMTIVETCENPTVTETDKTSHGYDRLNMAYTIHIESGIMSANENLYIDNCILKNKHRPCIGAGLRQDYGIVLKNTQCHSGIGFINPSSGGNGCRGALYFHTTDDDSNTTGQTFYAENCVFECDDEKYATINGYYNNTMEVTFIGNTFWSGTKGKSEEGLSHNVPIGGESIISLSGKSNGNNVNLLNHE